DNALAGLRHLCDSGDGPAALALALDLCWYWQMLGRHGETVFWLREALAEPGDVDPVVLDYTRAVYLLNLRIIDPVAPPDLDGALVDLDAARALSAEFGSLDVNDEIFLHLRRCDLYQRRGEPELAAAALADARALTRRSPPEIGLLVDALEAGLLTRQGEV